MRSSEEVASTCAATSHASTSGAINTSTITPSVSSVFSIRSANSEVACLVLESARYQNMKTNKLVDLPVRVVFKTETTTRFNAMFDCCIEGCLELDVSDLRAVASFVVFTPSIRKYDEAIQEIAKLIDQHYIVLYDHEAVFEVLCLEIPTHLFFNVGHNVLIQNEALRRGGKYWYRTGSRCAKLCGLWRLVENGNVPENPVNRADGLFTIYNRVGAHLPPQVVVAGTSSQSSTQWNSVVPMWRPVKRVLNIESISDAEKHPRVSRSLNPVLSLPIVLKPIPLFHFEAKLSFNEHTFKFATVNALQHAFPLAGVALRGFLRERYLL